MPGEPPAPASCPCPCPCPCPWRRAALAALLACVLGWLPACARLNALRPTDLVPDYAVTQHGGYVGFATLGAGWQVGRWYETNLQAGYVPEFAGGRAIWQLTNKHEAHVPLLDLTRGPRPWRLGVLHVGMSAIYSPSDDLWLVLPERYPYWYYYPLPTALRLAPYAGTRLRWGRHEVFVEYTALDLHLLHFFQDRNDLDTRDLRRLGTYAIGYKLLFP